MRTPPPRSLAIAAALVALAALTGAAAPGPNGFDLSKATVPAKEIVSGGPKRDEIQAVDSPAFASLDEASAVAPNTPVLGVEIGGKAHAYGVHLLEFHQIVNDELGGTPIAVTYDPLTGCPRVFDRRVDGRTLRFAVSGLVWNAGFLMYDRETQSLWSQFEGRALSGPLAGKQLTRVLVRQETTAAWLERAPQTLFLERPDRKRIDYRYSPFQGYWVEDKVPFPVKAEDRRYHAKEVVLGVEVRGKRRAYLGSIVTSRGGNVVDELAGERIELAYDTQTGLFRWKAGPAVDVTESYWFAWKAFRPDTEIWRESAPGPVKGTAALAR